METKTDQYELTKSMYCSAVLIQTAILGWFLKTLITLCINCVTLVFPLPWDILGMTFGISGGLGICGIYIRFFFLDRAGRHNYSYIWIGIGMLAGWAIAAYYIFLANVPSAIVFHTF